MYTEVLGFLIIVGALVVLVIRRQMKPTEERQTADAAEQMRLELERSADEIIARMGEHMDHLEALIAEADKRIALLDHRAAEPPNGQSDTDFSRLLADSLQQEEETAGAAAAESFAEAAVPAESSEPDTSFARARELLQQGAPAEEIARETNIGRGAIELLRQMQERRL